MYLSSRQQAEYRYIRPDRYEELVSEQRNRSFIGQDLLQLPKEMITSRIDELQYLEDKFYFYFSGEKAWLLAYQQHNKSAEFAHYAAWVRYQFSHELGVQFRYVANLGFEQPKWHAEIDISERIFQIPELQHAIFFANKDQTLQLSVSGDNTAPYAPHLIRLYEFLHDLEFIFANITRKSTQETIKLVGIGATSLEDPMFWHVRLEDEGGEVIIQNLLGRKLWRDGE